MSNQVLNHKDMETELKADCANCFGLCCVALPYAKSADFAFDKDGGTPCRNLHADNLCKIHENLRGKGFRGCAVYECFGAGQKVSQVTFEGKDWRENPDSANEMFEVFPIMQQLHEMLLYLNEAKSLEETKLIHKELQSAFDETAELTAMSPEALLNLDVPFHRAKVNEWLLKTSELVRSKAAFKKKKNQNSPGKKRRGTDYLGANLRGADLRGENLRGALLIAADLRNADLRVTDLIGADMRDANLSGANLLGSIFLTQAQINSANGDRNTRLPASLSMPEHWL